MPIREIFTNNPSRIWNHLKNESSGPQTLILVNNLLMEREVRKKWQELYASLSPDIQTLSQWMQDLALHSIPEKELPHLLLSPEERTLWLRQWLSTHRNPDFRKYSGVRQVTAISNIIGKLYSGDITPGRLLSYLRNPKETRSASSQNIPSVFDGASKSDSGRERDKAEHFLLSEDYEKNKHEHTIPLILSAYEKETERLKWLDKERLPSIAKEINSSMVRHEKIILYLIMEEHPVARNFLERVAHSASKRANPPEIVIIRPEKDPESELPLFMGRKIDSGRPKSSKKEMDIRPESEFFDEDTEADGIGGSTGRRLSDFRGHYFHEHHHPREELEQAIRQIIALMSHKSQQTGPFSKLISDNTPNSSSSLGTRYEDYVILTGDLTPYETLAPSAGERFEIPLYCSRGPTLISHPFIRRFLTYLKMEDNDFQIDDIFRVFADNQLTLPDLHDHNEQIPPNIRHFSQFCCEYNFRTLEEVSDGIPRIMKMQLNEAQNITDPERKENVLKKLTSDHDFYSRVIALLHALRRHYQTPSGQTIKEWADWAASLLSLQTPLKSEEAYQSRRMMYLMLNKLSEIQDKLNLRQSFTRSDFFKLFELRLKESRERPQEKPGGVLVTEIRQLPEVHDKIVFLLGLYEEGFPKTIRPDFLHFRYEGAIERLSGRQPEESYALARLSLKLLLDPNMPRFLSRPLLVDQKPVMPSPLWIEMAEEIKFLANESDACRNNSSTGKKVSKGGKDYGRTPFITHRWPVSQEKWLMSQSEKGRLKALVEKGKEPLPADDDISYPYCLAAYVQEKRNDITEMGRYDGVVDKNIMQKWWPQQLKKGHFHLSISRLDTFASSPQEYFFKYVLRLRPLHEYIDDAESTIKGTLLHQVLQNFYSETKEEGPPVFPCDDPEAAQNRLTLILKRLIKNHRHQLGNPETPFPGILCDNLENVTRWFLIEEQKDSEILKEPEKYRPASLIPESKIEMEHEWNFEIELAGIKVLFRGIIDRIDLNRADGSVLIYDYKSGSSSVRNFKDIVAGQGFQLPVYAMYIRNRGIKRFVSGYYVLPIRGKKSDVKRKFMLASEEMIKEEHLYTKNGKRKKNRGQFMAEEQINTFMQALETRRMAWIVTAIREGNFHTSVTGNPPWSDYTHINRFEPRIQTRRKLREMRLRKNLAKDFVLSRYYLHEPFWDEDSNGQ